ncbi:DUF5694 domain-containing protein [Aestuariivivens sediminicola]|uniref:DUF5694 domain-containing protein n=1 Tax=Aestuariivivens sediminicola TaxID=2913560 RepID=UPI001F5754AE|nr:DUF5694 domain-containing protein [Aestuariivivens sediminicola]
MSKFKWIVVLWLMNVSQLVSAQESEKKTISILGVFHFGTTYDGAAIKMENTLGEKRQGEIIELVEKLQVYRPTKVLLEYPFKDQDRVQQRYSDYLNENHVLDISEAEQIGFRLAEALKHDKIYAIDYKLDMPFDPVYEYCQINNKMDDFNGFIQKINGFTASETDRLTKMSLSEYLAHMNSEAFDVKANELYLKDVFAFGDPLNEVGVEATATWFKRNMIMLNNIDRVVEPMDRVLVIVGQAHRALIKSFIKNRTDLVYEEISGYLK